MKSSEIRAAFLNFFSSLNHQTVSSSSLVPENDATLLFTNAGMVQFKDVFLGRDKRGYKRAASSQRCVRAGGKHNDLENVGYTARHHTFFEMLGNFSFGDYFKREAIQYAWQFLTQELGLSEEKLWITVYKDDQEAEAIWLQEMGVSPDRFSRLGDKDNFWSMGEVGPCGPCSEIFYDHGSDVPGGPPGSPDEDGDRYIEIWNLVFMQFDRQPNGELIPLPKPSVDTGMGLERIAAVMQGVHSNYEIDLFQNLLAAVAEVTGTTDLSNKSLRVIADHIRSCAFLISDGVTPSNEGRGYVLRRIIRRALRHGNQLGVTEPFFHKIVAGLALEMGVAYPELKAKQAQIEKTLLTEEKQFAKTLDQGLKVLQQGLEKIDATVISGELIFKLYDTYGFPADLTADVAREMGYTMDMEGFERCMVVQQERARAASSFGADYQSQIKVDQSTVFEGYEQAILAVKVEGVYDLDGNVVDCLEEGASGLLLLEQTPFYAESGGQVGDQGIIEGKEFSFLVKDTRKVNQAFLHMGLVEQGVIRIGASAEGRIDESKRRVTAANHSATHLMHAALRELLGDHVEQKGSLVSEHHLRFDFSHPEAVTREQLVSVENLVNQHVRANTEIKTELKSLEAAKKEGVMALFGEKYDDDVRVLSMGADDFSVELCGGTHAQRCGDIGVFKIVSESSVAAGVRRIDAVTGAAAIESMQSAEHTVFRTSQLLKAKKDSIIQKLEDTLQRNRGLEKEIAALKGKLASSAGSDLMGQVKQVAGINLLSTKIDGADAKSLRGMLDQLKNKIGSGVIVVATADGSKVSLVAGVTKDLTDRFKAGELVNFVAQQVGGKGGGRADMAQAGGSDPSKLSAALKSVQSWVEQKA